MTAILPTKNEAWGFFGTIGHHADRKEAWALASEAISAATGCSAEAVRAFLDSRHGRHFADEVASGLVSRRSLGEAIALAIDVWMGWTISRHTHRQTGIPAGLPYLSGFVVHEEVMGELAA